MENESPNDSPLSAQQQYLADSTLDGPAPAFTTGSLIENADNNLQPLPLPAVKQSKKFIFVVIACILITVGLTVAIALIIHKWDVQ